ncbi:MAG: nicotinamide mononucleotide transporter [Ruminococcaceae bacterium]|nr:nicotinamide mononucleotide transporter [Oscillospiraceae bacterium]
MVSLVGFTALIFTAKGLVLGQILIVIFATLYGIISYRFAYYGEMITYLGMSAPVAIVAIAFWLRHPYKKSKQVAVHRMRGKEWALLSLLTVIVTVLFYFVLRALGTASLIVSTVSVATSFFAASLTVLRSPFYALAYTANDAVLIVLWIAASMKDISSLPMVICFVMFLANDLYGLYSWLRMQKEQAEDGLTT